MANATPQETIRSKIAAKKRHRKQLAGILKTTDAEIVAMERQMANTNAKLIVIGKPKVAVKAKPTKPKKTTF